MSKKKIFILPMPGFGHVNPVCGLVHELCQQPDVECVIYGQAEFESIMKNTGAEYRPFAFSFDSYIAPPMLTERDKNNLIWLLLNVMIDGSYSILPQLIRDVETDKPDLIIFDASFIIGRYFVEIVRKKHPTVKFVEFYPNFVITREMLAKVPGFFKLNFGFFISMIIVFFRQISLNWTFGLSKHLNPLNLFNGDKDLLKIVAVFPEFHPDLQNYDAKHKFVGQCVSEEARNHEISDDPELKAVLELFPPKDSNTTSTSSDLKLIYMSLGTVFHINGFIFERFLNDICDYDKKPNRHFKAAQFQIIMSVGDKSLKMLNEKSTKGELKIPNNILIRAKVPQLEVLKRADLFITHNGMNSTSETIKYAVPIVSIPIEGDQHFVSHRACDELAFGIRLDPMKLRPGDIADSIDQVLSDEKFRRNIDEMSRISAKYNGKKEGAQIILEYIDQGKPVKSTSSNIIKSNQVQPLIKQ